MLHHLTEQPMAAQAYLALLLEPTATREHLELAFNAGLLLLSTLQRCRGEVHIGGEHLQESSVLNLDGGDINGVIAEPGARNLTSHGHEDTARKASTRTLR